MRKIIAIVVLLTTPASAQQVYYDQSGRQLGYSVPTGNGGQMYYGSGGQQRTAAIALRMVEAETIREARGREPVVLLDDVFAVWTVAYTFGFGKGLWASRGSGLKGIERVPDGGLRSGKGAAGAAVQNLNLMLGVDEATGLS